MNFVVSLSSLTSESAVLVMALKSESHRSFLSGVTLEEMTLQRTRQVT